ncbi:MAG: UbiA family prenyltransferase [candidate division Zixibacteria bacterium]|nr:UbiA family prenyltransferase [candidate division Zixibacteria bacterium]
MKALDYFFAARPLLHLPIWSIYLVAVKYHHDLTGQSFDLSDLGIMAGWSLLATSALYINQIYDYESDRINQKLGFLQNNIVEQSALYKGFLLTSASAIALTLLYPAATRLIFLQAFLLSYIYSVPPVRLKNRPFWGLFANAYACGTLISFSVMPELSVHNAGLLGWDNPLYFGLSVGAIYLLTTIPDVAGDKATGKKTLAIALGMTGEKCLALLFMLGSALFAFSSNFIALLVLSLISSALICLTIFIKSEKIILLAIKLPLLLLTLFAGYWYPLYFVFVVVLVGCTRLYFKVRFNIIYPRLA